MILVSIKYIEVNFTCICISTYLNLINYRINRRTAWFRARNSILTNSVIFTSYVIECLEQKNKVDIIFTDFRKAFDKVDHGLIKKL